MVHNNLLIKTAIFNESLLHYCLHSMDEILTSQNASGLNSTICVTKLPKLGRRLGSPNLSNVSQTSNLLKFHMQMYHREFFFEVICQINAWNSSYRMMISIHFSWFTNNIILKLSLHIVLFHSYADDHARENDSSNPLEQTTQSFSQQLSGKQKRGKSNDTILHAYKVVSPV